MTTETHTNHSSGDWKIDHQLKTELAQFFGDLIRYRHPFNRQVIYTPGVRHLAEKGKAYWLIDAIASWIGSEPFQQAAAEDYRINSMHFWKFERNRDKPSILYAKADSPDEAFIIQEIEYTDFPLPEISIWAGFDGEHWVLYLPSEH